MFKILKTFFKFSTQKRFPFAVFILLVMISTLLANLTPYFYKLFIDKIPNGDFKSLFSILCLYIVVRVVGLLASIANHWVGDFNLIDVAADVRSKIFKQVQDLDFSFHSNKSTGSLISIFKRGDG